MPRTGQFDPTSTRARVLAWLDEHPGMHRCVTIANGLGLTTHQVAVACWGLMEQNRVTRATAPARNGGRAFTVYGAADALDRPTTSEKAASS